MFARLKIWLWPCVIAVAAGCVHYQPQPLSPAQAAAEFERRRLDGAALDNFFTKQLGQPPAPWPPEKWDLNSLTLAAFYFHPDLAVARDQWLVAQAGIETARARPNPSVSFSPSYDTQIPNNPSPWIIPVTLDIPLETAGKRAKRIAEAEHAAESARWSYVSAAWQIRGGVRTSLLDFILAGRRAELLQQQVAAQTEIVKLLQQRFDAGSISRPELTAAHIALDQSRLASSGARAAQAVARSQLAQAVGVSLAALDDLKLEYDFAVTVPESFTTTDARDVALRGRADILGALADYAAAEADLRLQIAKQYPDLHLGPGYAWNNGNAGDNQWTLGATLELPILDQNQGPIAEAEARRKLAAAKFLALQAQVGGEVERAVTGLAAARQQMQTGNALLDSAERQEKAIEQQVQAGAADKLDLVSARMELTTIRLAQLDNKAQLQTAAGALEDALQSPADQFAAAIQKITAENPKNPKAPQP